MTDAKVSDPTTDEKKRQDVKAAAPVDLDAIKRQLFAEPNDEVEPIGLPEEPAKAVDTVMEPLTSALMGLSEKQMDADAGKMRLAGAKNKADKVYGVILSVLQTASGFEKLTAEVKKAIEQSTQAQAALAFARSVVASEGECSTWSKLKAALSYALATPAEVLSALVAILEDKDNVTADQLEKLAGKTRLEGAKNKADKVYGALLAIDTTESGFDKLPKAAKDAIKDSPAATHALSYVKWVVAAAAKLGTPITTWKGLKDSLENPVPLAPLCAILEDKDNVTADQLEKLAGKTRLEGAKIKADKVYGALLAIATTESGFDKLPKAAKDAIKDSPAARHALAQLCAVVSAAGAKAPKTWAELKEVNGPRSLDFSPGPVELS